MLALLHDGPFGHQHHDVEDPPPEIVTVEAMPTGDDMLTEIKPGERFPDSKFERHDYRLVGIDTLLTPRPDGESRLPVYGYVRGA